MTWTLLRARKSQVGKLKGPDTAATNWLTKPNLRTPLFHTHSKSAVLLMWKAHSNHGFTDAMYLSRV